MLIDWIDFYHNEAMHEAWIRYRFMKIDDK